LNGLAESLDPVMHVKAWSVVVELVSRCSTAKKGVLIKLVEWPNCHFSRPVSGLSLKLLDGEDHVVWSMQLGVGTGEAVPRPPPLRAFNR
jgi:hypothetical protein